MSTIAVLGPGSVGGFVAAALARGGESVVVVAREGTAAVIAERGLEVRSATLGSFTTRATVVTRLESEVDCLLVSTKAGGLESALKRVAVDPALVVPLLNGLDHMALLRARFGVERVSAGVIRIESDRPDAGVIVQTSPSARIDLAAGTAPGPRARLARLGEALETAGFDVRQGGGERQVLWSKLARLNALALTTSASDRPIGFVRSDPHWRPALEGAIAETVRVANLDGASLDGAATLAELEGAHAELGSSMQRDIAAGREPELDAIAGAVLRAARRHGLQCPTVAWLAGQVAERAGIDFPG